MYLPYFVRAAGAGTVMNKAAFFDRDGTINVDTGYLFEPEKLEFVPGTPELIRRCNEAGYLVIVVTNQSGIARGIFSEGQMLCLHDIMNRRLQEEYGAHIDAFYFCPHLPEITGECDCRKPKPGMFLRAMEEYNIDPCISLSFGDSARDEKATRAAGISDFRYVVDHMESQTHSRTKFF